MKTGSIMIEPNAMCELEIATVTIRFAHSSFFGKIYPKTIQQKYND